jgi:arginine repressor
MIEVNKSQAIRDYYKSNPKATPQEVVDALAKKSITVTTNLVTTVKSQHNTARAAKKAAKNQAAPAKTADKKPEVNKTQAVRDFLKKNKKAKNQEVVDALAKQGITISANYVGIIKSKHNTRRKAVRTVVAKGGVGIPEIKAALAFIKLTGSVAAAKAALAVAQEIREIV